MLVQALVKPVVPNQFKSPDELLTLTSGSFVAGMVSIGEPPAIYPIPLSKELSIKNCARKAKQTASSRRKGRQVEEKEGVCHATLRKVRLARSEVSVTKCLLYS